MIDLARLALEARANAYAPYSGYRVGATLRSADGSIWNGCNVENVSYGLSICAERSAIFSMVAGGPREIAEIAVATRDGGTPCGACLQVLLEFSPDPNQVLVHMVSEDGGSKTFPLSELIPHGFASPSVARTER